jgi:anti-sigma factor RsiW
MIEVDCAEARDLLHFHADDELGADERAAMVRHIGRCERCRAELEAIETLRSRIKSAGPHALPAGLESRIAAALDAESRRLLAVHVPLWRRYGAMAASHLLIAVLAAGLVYGVLTSGQSNERAVREAINAHVRAGLTNQLVQVASSDTHTVKPWLAARLPFSPDVTDFAANGFPLIGGRIDYLLDKPVASLVYMRRQHAITVFVAPAEDKIVTSPTLAANRNGYHVASWRDGSSVYIATSDASLSDFNEFVGLAQANRSR